VNTVATSSLTSMMYSCWLESFSEENRLIIISMQNVDVPRDEITKLLNIITLITRNTYKIMDALRIESREL
jgi:hypothetical protein